MLWRIRNGRRHQVWDTRSGGANLSRIVSPGFSGRFLYFAATNVGSGAGNRIYRQSLASGRLAQARGSSQYTSIGRLGHGGFAVARSGLDACDTGRCTLSLTDPVSFRGL